MTKSVALQKCSNYSFDDVYNCITKMMELVPPPDVRNKVVLIKPNILYPKRPDLAVCTHPVVVGAAVVGAAVVGVCVGVGAGVGAGAGAGVGAGVGTEFTLYGVVVVLW